MRIKIFPDISFIQGEINKIFDRFLSTTAHARKKELAWIPLVDCYETDEQLIFKIEIPGVDPEDIKLEVHSGYLYIEGMRCQVGAEQNKGFLRVERSFGRFSRYIPINQTVNCSKAEATLKNGMLMVKFPIIKQDKRTNHSINIKHED